MKGIRQHIKFQTGSRIVDILYRLRIKKYKKKKQGARWAKDNEVRQFMNSENKGVTLDGHIGRLSEKDSYQHFVVFGSTGTGKSSVYAITNLINLAKTNCSIVVNDPKGELLEATGAIFQKNGFDLKSLNPENKNQSDRFNIFLNCKKEEELDKFAQVLVTASSNGENKGEIWNKGAMRLISVLLKFLKNAGTENKAYNTLGNLYYCFQRFGDMGKGLHEFAFKYSFPENDFYVYHFWLEWKASNKLKGDTFLDQVNHMLENLNTIEPQNMRLWNEWLGAVQGNREGVNSFVLNAITALRSLSNENIDTITASSTFNLEDIRQKKTVIFLITPPAHQDYYHFFVSLFFVSVFNMASSKKPTNDTLPLYCIYDEFGLSSIPNMENYANTVRSYKVSISILLQNINQLALRYGQTEAKDILGAFLTKANFTGSDNETKEYFEKLCGKVIEYEPVLDKETKKIYKRRHEYNLINAGDLATLPKDEALIVHFNRYPIIKKIYPYYEVPNYHEETNLPFEQNFEKPENSLVYVPLK